MLYNKRQKRTRHNMIHVYGKNTQDLDIFYNSIFYFCGTRTKYIKIYEMKQRCQFTDARYSLSLKNKTRMSFGENPPLLLLLMQDTPLLAFNEHLMIYQKMCLYQIVLTIFDANTQYTIITLMLG